MDYYSRCELEVRDGYPALPCPKCGNDEWDVTRPSRRSKYDRPVMFLAICTHCHISETAHHVDGEWMGAWEYAGRLGITVDSLYEFVMMEAEDLRSEWAYERE